MRKLKILFLNDTILRIGGAENYMYSLKELLEAEGHSVKIIGGNKGVSLKDSFFSRWYSFKYYFEVKKVIKYYSPDIVHIHGISRVISPSVLVASSWSHVPIVQTVHDYHFICPKLWMINDKGEIIEEHGSFINCLLHHLPKKNIFYSTFKSLKTQLHNYFFERYINGFVCASKDLSSRYKKRFDKEKVFYLPYFINKKKFIYSHLKNYNELLFVGRLSREKGIETLLRAFKEVLETRPNVNLTLIGEGNQSKVLESYCRDNGIMSNVKLLGKKNEDEVNFYYKNSSIVIIPSIWLETGPLTAYEAISTGRPIIGSNCGGLLDLVENNFNGYLFKRNDYKDLSQKILSLILNKRKIKEMSINQKKLIKNYTSEKYVKEICKIYKNIIIKYEK